MALFHSRANGRPAQLKTDDYLMIFASKKDPGY
jgi:hypothetical protein